MKESLCAYLQVEKLDLSSNGISESDVPLLATVIAALTSMKSLDLSGNPIDDTSGACCQLLKHCIAHKVAHVKLPASVLSTAPEHIALDLFECMGNLQTLDISGSILTEAMCASFATSLRHMTRLQHLGLWGVMLWGQGGTRAATMVVGERQRHPQTGVPILSMLEHVNGVFENLLELKSLEIGPTTAHLRNAGVIQMAAVCIFKSSCNLWLSARGPLSSSVKTQAFSMGSVVQESQMRCSCPFQASPSYSHCESVHAT